MLPARMSTRYGVSAVARRRKPAVAPISKTVSTDPAKDTRTVLIDNRPKGTPQTSARTTGANNPTTSAAINVVVIVQGEVSER